MKFIISIVAALMLVVCSACQPENEIPENTSEPSNGAIVDLNQFEIDSYTKDLSGFEGLPWRYTLPVELTETLTDKNQLSLVDSTEFAGLTFRAERVFTPGDAGLEMKSGLLVRNGYFDPQNIQYSTEMIVDDYNFLITYLTNLYGEPDTGGDVVTAESFAMEYSPVGTTWVTPSVAIILRMSSDYGGMIMINFSTL